MTSTQTIFASALAQGLLFLPNAKFKLNSLQANLREEELTLPGTFYPTIQNIRNYLNSNINAPFFNNCLAFSINNNKRVVYKYQLFYEDIELSSTSLDPTVGIYVRNLDDYMTLKPDFNNFGFRGYGGINGDGGRDYISIAKNLSQEDFLKVVDNGWFIMNWNEFRVDVGKRNFAIVGFNDNNFLITTAKTNNRAVFKLRRISKDNFEIYSTNGNVLSNNWQYVIPTIQILNGVQGGGAWSATKGENGYTQYTISELKSSQNLNYFYTAAKPNPIKRINSPPTFFEVLKDEFGLINIKDVHLEVDKFSSPSTCFLSSDVIKENCSANPGSGNIIQPSLSSIIERLLNIKNNDTEYNLGVNLCANSSIQSNDFLIDPNLYPLTNEFISNIIGSKTSYCINKSLTFCGQDDITGKSNLFTTECKTFCSKDANCINIVKDYCTSKGSLALDSTNRVICGCNTVTESVQQAYDRYILERARKNIPDSGCRELKYVFSPCRVSSYGNSQGTTNITPGDCEQKASCYSFIEVNNQGNITGMDVDIDVKLDCKTITNLVESGTQSCASSSDCKDTEFKKCVNGFCVQCDKNSDCSDTRPICDISKNVCSECADDSNCSVSKPFCVNGNCTVCKDNSNCGEGKKCSNGRCVNECITAADCGSNKTCTSEGKCINSVKSTTYVIYGIIGISILLVLLLAIRIYKRSNR